MRGLICVVLTASLALLTCGGCGEDTTKGKKKPSTTPPAGVSVPEVMPEPAGPDVGPGAPAEGTKTEPEAKGEKATEEKEGAKPEATEPKTEKKPDEGKSDEKKPEEK